MARAETPHTQGLTLEPISNAAGVDTDATLRSSKVRFAHMCAPSLDCTSYNVPLQPPIIPSFLAAPTINQLVEYGVLTEVNRGAIKCFMKAFMVPKSSGGGRFICHPKYLNEQEFPSPGCKGLSMALLIRELCGHFDGLDAKELHALECDFRNFFPQLRMPERSQGFFGISSSMTLENSTD